MERGQDYAVQKLLKEKCYEKPVSAQDLRQLDILMLYCTVVRYTALHDIRCSTPECHFTVCSVQICTVHRTIYTCSVQVQELHMVRYLHTSQPYIRPIFLNLPDSLIHQIFKRLQINENGPVKGITTESQKSSALFTIYLQ